jgi:hypothetical protein
MAITLNPRIEKPVTVERTQPSTTTTEVDAKATPENTFAAADGTPAERPSTAASGVEAPGALKGPMAARMTQLHATKLTAAATEAAARAVHEGNPQHPLLEQFGEAMGKVLGVVVTEALALIPSWNKPVLDAAGKPVSHVDGADRIGDHDILKRHQEVVGPQIEAYVKTLAPGLIHDLLDGLGKGASAAPGISYRLEASVEDLAKKP